MQISSIEYFAYGKNIEFLDVNMRNRILLDNLSYRTSMKINFQLTYLLKFAIAGIAVSCFSSHLNAWDIYVLNSANTSSGNGVLNRPFDVFEDYMTGTGATLTASSLSDYNIGDSDAVIVNLTDGLYSSAELSVLNELLHSNVRVLVFGEHRDWANSNQQLAGLVGGVYSTDGMELVAQSVISNDFPMITGGIDTIYFDAYSKISPSNGNGHSLVDDDGMTLWGDNDNFLILMDVDGISNLLVEEDEYGNLLYPQNDLLAKNIANWLSGSDQVIPEPSAYGLIFGTAALGLTTMRRRKK